MTNETIATLKNMTEERKVKIKQLSVFQAKEDEKNAEAARLNELLEQAKKSHDALILSNLSGIASDENLKESKINLNGLADSVQEIKDTIKLISEAKAKLNQEIESLSDDIKVRRGDLCRKSAEEAYVETSTNKKLNEKLVAGYAACMLGNPYDRSWLAFLARSFPHPSERDMQLAVEKFKASNEFMAD